MVRWKTEIPCKTELGRQATRLIAITGGPGAGKSAVLEFAGRIFCHHVVELPEAASIIFGGGFWRKDSLPAKQAAQRAIYHVQRELERLVEDEHEAAVALCDRGTVDGYAYWPDNHESYWQAIGIDHKNEMMRYHAVIHLRPPSSENGYNHRNYLRIESADEAARIDARIEKAWEGHPRRFFVDSTLMFVEKVSQSIKIIEGLLPDECVKTAKHLK